MALLAGLPTGLLSGCSPAQPATGPSSGPTGPAVLAGQLSATSGLPTASSSPSPAAAALAHFRSFARAQAEGKPFAVSYVLTTYGAAEAQVTPGDTDSTDPHLPAIAMTAVGHFDGSLEHGPPGWRPPPATAISAAVLLPSGGFACWSEGNRVADLAALGAVQTG